MSKNMFSKYSVNTVINPEFVSRKAMHSKNILAFAAKVQASVIEAEEPWEAAEKAARELPKKERALYGQLLKWVEVYAPAREQADADTVWPEAWAGEWDCDDPDTIWDQRWHASRRERVADFKAAFTQLLPHWVTECLKKPLY